MYLSVLELSVKKIQMGALVNKRNLDVYLQKQKTLQKSIVNEASEQDVIRYKNYRNCLNRLKRKLKTDYYQNLCTSLKKNTKKLWEIVNHTLGKEKNKSCAVERLKIGSITYENPMDISNGLASYFANVGLNYSNAITKSTVKIEII